MKTLLLIFVVFTLQNLVISKNDPLEVSSMLGRVYPKKYNPVLHKNLKIINRMYTPTNKVLKSQVQVLPKNKTKRGNEGYTVFPPHTNESVSKVDIPGSPYFPGPENNDQKSRVKKVLSDYIWNSRKKRAAVHQDEKKIVKNTKGKKENRPAQKDAKIENVIEKKAKTVEKLVKKKESQHVKDSKKQISGKTESKFHGKKGGKKGKHGTVSRKRKQKSKVLSKGHGKLKRGAINGINKRGLRKGKKHARNGTKSDHKPAVKKDPEASRRLVAAQEALIEDYPYVVSIQKNEEHWCAGALLNPRLVITTANCVWKSSRISRMRVRAGSRNADSGGQVVKIQEVLKHPSWSVRRNPDCDVALLLLNKNVRFGHHVHGVDLPNRAMMPVFDDAWITSWGSERRDGIFEKRPMTLQVVHARLMDRGKCNNVTKRFGVAVTENFICLAQTGKRAPCTRDTGAPAVSDGVLWGLASWGIRKLCGTERFPAVFSYIASQSNMDFITNATTYLMSEERNSPFLARYNFFQPAVTVKSTTDPDLEDLDEKVENQYLKDQGL